MLEVNVTEQFEDRTLSIAPIKHSELILNEDGSVYHLNLKPENISDTIIVVGDQYRVEKITKHFDSIEFETPKERV